MPRDGGGHDQVPVCCFCIPNLNSEYIFPRLRVPFIHCAVTAGSKVDLLGLTILKLKNYADAYDLHHDQIIEKDDLVEKLMRYRVSLIVPIYTSSPINTSCRRLVGGCPEKMRYVLLDLEPWIVHVSLSRAGFLQEAFGPLALSSPEPFFTADTPGTITKAKIPSSIPFPATGCRTTRATSPLSADPPSNKYATDTTATSIQRTTSIFPSTTAIQPRRPTTKSVHQAPCDLPRCRHPASATYA